MEGSRPQASAVGGPKHTQGPSAAGTGVLIASYIFQEDQEGEAR